MDRQRLIDLGIISDGIIEEAAKEAASDFVNRANARNQQVIVPVTPEERVQICKTCFHLKRYHTIKNPDAVASVGDFCKYESCRDKCRGYEQRDPNKKKWSRYSK